MSEETKSPKDPMAEQSKFDFMPNLTDKTSDTLIYYKFLDPLTQGKAIRVKNLLLGVLQIVLFFFLLLIFLGTRWFFIKPSYGILPAIILFLLTALVLYLTIRPIYNQSAFNYVLNYRKGLKAKIIKDDKRKEKFEDVSITDEKGNITFLLVGNGRMSDMLFDDERMGERDLLATGRNELAGITITSSKGFADKGFETQKEQAKQIVENTDDEAMKTYAKKYLLGIRKRLQSEKVEVQYVTFKTHNEKERNKLFGVLDDWSKSEVFSYDLEQSKKRIKEIYEEF